MFREKKIIHIGKNLINAFAAGTRHELTLRNMTEKLVSACAVRKYVKHFFARRG